MTDDAAKSNSFADTKQLYQFICYLALIVSTANQGLLHSSVDVAINAGASRAAASDNR